MNSFGLFATNVRMNATGRRPKPQVEGVEGIKQVEKNITNYN